MILTTLTGNLCSPFSDPDLDPQRSGSRSARDLESTFLGPIPAPKYDPYTPCTPGIAITGYLKYLLATAIGTLTDERTGFVIRRPQIRYPKPLSGARPKQVRCGALTGTLIIGDRNRCGAFTGTTMSIVTASHQYSIINNSYLICSPHLFTTLQAVAIIAVLDNRSRSQG